MSQVEQWMKDTAWEVLDCPIRQPHLCTREHMCGTCAERYNQNLSIIARHAPAAAAASEREAGLEEAAKVAEQWCERIHLNPHGIAGAIRALKDGGVKCVGNGSTIGYEASPVGPSLRL